MTLVMAAIDESTGMAIMAADTMVVDGWSTAHLASSASKTCSKNAGQSSVTFGCAGDAATAQALQHLLDLTETPGPPPRERSAVPWMVSTFVPAVKAALRAAGRLKVSEGLESAKDGAMLVTTGWSIFELDEKFSVLESTRRFAAIGVGAEIALGALAAFERSMIGSWPWRMVAAYEIACAHKMGVGGELRFALWPTELNAVMAEVADVSTGVARPLGVV